VKPGRFSRAAVLLAAPYCVGRLRVRPLLAAACALTLGACASIVPERAPQSYFKLEAPAKADPQPNPASNLPRIDRSLVIVPSPLGAAGAAYALAYARSPGERAFYQHAQWIDRPNQRIAQMLLQRLEARRRFAAVSQLGSGVAGDLLANVIVDDLYHDLTGGGAGVGRVDLTIELVDRSERTLIGRKRFTAATPAAIANSEAAAAALNRSVDIVLDQAAVWIEQQTARAPPAAAAAAPSQEKAPGAR
jgi:ABC-type uncharacterized transport system auxiliary subunit